MLVLVLSASVSAKCAAAAAAALDALTLQPKGIALKEHHCTRRAHCSRRNAAACIAYSARAHCSIGVS